MTTLINRFDIGAIAKECNLRYMVETGTGTGHSMYENAKYFKRVYTMEIHKKTYDIAQKTLQTVPNVKLYNLESMRALPMILPLLNGPTLFYLDARFPGNMMGEPINLDEELSLNVPAQRELNFLLANRRLGHDVIIIGGMHIWSDGPFGAGPFTSRKELSTANPRPMLRQFEASHRSTLLYKDEGYLILMPKQIAL